MAAIPRIAPIKGKVERHAFSLAQVVIRPATLAADATLRPSAIEISESFVVPMTVIVKGTMAWTMIADVA